MSDGDRTVINLAEVRSQTATSTSEIEPKISSETTYAGQLHSYPSQYQHLKPSGPSGPEFGTKAIYVAISVLFLWLGTITVMGFNESKEINNKISTNQEDLLKQISSSQIDLKNQLSDFERRQEADFRELQKMILEGQNQATQKNSRK